MRVLVRHVGVVAVVAMLAAGCAAQDDPAPDGVADADPSDDVGTEPSDQPPPEDPGTGSGAGADDPSDVEAREDDASEAAPSEAALEALDVQGRTLDGERFDGRELAGGPVVLWMWAPW